MSSIEGMDTGQVESLANQIDANAQALYNLVTSLNGVIGGLIFLWNGPVAARFEQQWQSKNRPALMNAHAILVNLHSELIKNVNQQRSASAADRAYQLVGNAHTVLDTDHTLGEKKFNPHTKDNREYEIGTKNHHITFQLNNDSKLEKFFNYHDSPLLRAAHDSSFVQKTDRILVDTRIADFLGPVGLFLALPDMAANTGEVISDLQEHHYNSAIMHLGNIAEDTGNPIGLLAGGLTRLLAEDYEQGKQIADGTQQPLDLGQGILKTGALTLKAFFE